VSASRRAFAGGVLALAGLLSGCAGNQPGLPAATPTATPRQPNLLAAFNLCMRPRPVRDQIALLLASGYTAIGLDYEPNEFAEFMAQPEILDGRLKLTTVLYEVYPARGGLDRDEFAAMVEAVSRLNGTVCLRVLSPQPLPREQLVGIVQEAADLFLARVGPSRSLILYPHYGEELTSIEMALEVMQAAGRSNLKLSLHLVHEMKAGNQNRLREVIDRTVSHVAMATINGADVQPDVPLNYYRRSLRPLYKGDFDVEHLYLRPLLEAGYTGPVVLHTWGLTEPPEEVYPGSLARWRQMMAAFGLPVGVSSGLPSR
jgi:sugar phosphate isomerase/epimerase